MNIEFSPGRIAGFDRFEHGSRHGKYPGIAARHYRNLPAFGSERERVTCPVGFDTIA